MKSLVLMFLVTACVGSAPEAAKKEVVSVEVNALDKKPEDCDEKAKKPVEITPEAISLSGTTGCSLDEAKP